MQEPFDISEIFRKQKILEAVITLSLVNCANLYIIFYTLTSYRNNVSIFKMNTKIKFVVFFFIENV